MSNATPPQMISSGGQRRDNVGNAGERDDEAVQQTLPGSSGQHDDREGERLAEGDVLHQTGGKDVRHRDHRADREVDATAEHDDRLGCGGKRERKSAERQRLNFFSNEPKSGWIAIVAAIAATSNSGIPRTRPTRVSVRKEKELFSRNAASVMRALLWPRRDQGHGRPSKGSLRPLPPRAFARKFYPRTRRSRDRKRDEFRVVQT